MFTSSSLILLMCSISLQLKRFGEGLREMKSSFLKKSKVLAHKGKATLYRKLVQNGQVNF